MAAIIQTRDLRFSYPAAEGVTPVVLDGVDLDIEEGSFVAVLGHNGCGKSTLAKHMNAILLPTGGAVYVDGMDTAGGPRSRFRALMVRSTSARPMGSSMAVGSSSTTHRGRMAMTPAMATRCFCPPERRWGACSR